MVALPDWTVDPTLEKMFEAMEAFEATKSRRSYLGASTLGHVCERKLWYEFNGYLKQPMKRNGICATQDGFRTEALILERLSLVPGIEIYTHDEKGQQFGFSKFDGKFRGHYDFIVRGLLQAPATWHLGEVKCCNEKKFNELKKCKETFGEKGALKEWDYQFYIQAMLYCGEEKLARHYLLCATPGGRDVISCRTEFNREVYNAMQGKAERIINAKIPPERHTQFKSHHVCKWCDFSEICWKDA